MNGQDNYRLAKAKQARLQEMAGERREGRRQSRLAAIVRWLRQRLVRREDRRRTAPRSREDARRGRAPGAEPSG